MGYATLAKGMFVLSKTVENLLSVHGGYPAQNWPDLPGGESVGRISISVIGRWSHQGGGLRLRLNPPYGLPASTGGSRGASAVISAESCRIRLQRPDVFALIKGRSGGFLWPN
jgi:hypothetical protein